MRALGEAVPQRSCERMVVRCADDAVASRAITAIGPRVSPEEWGDLTVEISGRYALCYARRGPQAIEEMVEVLGGFEDALPTLLPEPRGS